MIRERFFHLDCHPVIPECGYRCARCIEEVNSVIGNMPGVSEVSTGQREGISGIVVRFDPGTITEDRLLHAFAGLPSFYTGRFIPKVTDAV